MILRNTLQTKKKRFVTGGGPTKIKEKKYKKTWYNPKGLSFNSGLKKSTKSWYNPKRYLASTQTKKKREARAQRRDESHVGRKLYDYQRLNDSVKKYTDLEAEIKKAKEGGEPKEKIADLERQKKDAKALMYKLGNIPKGASMSHEKIKKFAEAGIKKYEEKQKYYEASTDKLKHDSIDFVKNRTEYIKNGKPDLVKKLDSLATHDHTKMAIIHVPGIGPKPVNKLKYSDFKVEDPKVTDAYLGQFKTVNDSMVKINKDFDINSLSAEHKVELAKELHKITKEGILDPAAQEQHYLKAVTDIAYKNKYYSTLDGKSKGAAFEYLKRQVPYTHPEDMPEPNLRQQKTALEQRRSRSSGSLSSQEAQKLDTEIAYLDKQLKQTPEGLDRQIRAQEALIRNISRLDPKYPEMSLALDRLKEHRRDINTLQKADFAADTELISSELAKAKDARGVFLASTKIDTSVDVEQLRRSLAELNERLNTGATSNESNTNTPVMTDKQRTRLMNKVNRLKAEIKKQEEFKQMQDTISELENMTPENREKLKGELQGKNLYELQGMLTTIQGKKAAFINNPTLQNIIQRDIEQISSAIKVENFKAQVDEDSSLVGLQKEHMKRQITSDMGDNDIQSLRTEIIGDKELNFRLAKQAANEKAAHAAAQRTASKQAYITAKQARKDRLNTIWKRTKASVTRTPEELRSLKRKAKSNKNYSEAVSRQTKRISNAVAQGKITPEKAKQLLRKFEEQHVGYVPANSIKLLRRVAEPNAKTLRTSNPIHYKNPLYEGYAARPEGFNNPQYGVITQQRVLGLNNPAYKTGSEYGTVEYASIANTPNKKNNIYNTINNGPEYLEILQSDE